MTTTNTPKAKDGQDIIEGLALNLKLSQELLIALHEESVALRAMDTQGLFRLSRQKDTLLAKIHYLDDSLKTLKTALTKEHKTSSTPELTSEQSQVIGHYKDKINSIRQEIQSRNMINKRFTEDTLGYLSDAIALISRPTAADNTYHIQGRSQARGRCLPSFISREA